MRTMLAVVLSVGLFACGGESKPAESKAPESKPAAAAPAPTPAPAPAAAPAGGDKWDPAASADAKKAWLLKKGEDVYKNGGSGGVACVTCHQADGKGVAGAFPPLAGQKDMMGDCKRHAGLVVHGLTGEIKIDGQTYNGQMPAQPTLPDEEIAAAISYERSNFGNDFGVCMPEDVAAARSAPAPAATPGK